MATRKTTTTTRRNRPAFEDTSTNGEVIVVRMECPCGWCMTGDCANCKTELVYMGKNYICGCKKCDAKDHVPSVGVEVDKITSKAKPEEPEETED